MLCLVSLTVSRWLVWFPRLLLGYCKKDAVLYNVIDRAEVHLDPIIISAVRNVFPQKLPFIHKENGGKW